MKRIVAIGRVIVPLVLMPLFAAALFAPSGVVRAAPKSGAQQGALSFYPAPPCSSTRSGTTPSPWSMQAPPWLLLLLSTMGLIPAPGPTRAPAAITGQRIP